MSEVAELSEYLKMHRDDAMLTQEELGERAGLSGYTISRIESSLVKPRVSTMRKIASALGIEPEELTARPHEVSPGQPQEPQHIEIAGLDILIQAARTTFTENQLFYLADAFAEIARQKRAEREQS